MELPYKCLLCGKTFRTPQGRRGHLTFKHGQGKKSVYTDAIGNLIEAHKEGIEHVKEKRKRIPRKALDEEKRKKALVLAESLRGYPKGDVRGYRKKDVFEGVDLGGVEIEKYGRRREPSWE